jgi:hypothetical protein
VSKPKGETNNTLQNVALALLALITFIILIGNMWHDTNRPPCDEAKPEVRDATPPPTTATVWVSEAPASMFTARYFIDNAPDCREVVVVRECAMLEEQPVKSIPTFVTWPASLPP